MAALAALAAIVAAAAALPQASSKSELMQAFSDRKVVRVYPYFFVDRGYIFSCFAYK